MAQDCAPPGRNSTSCFACPWKDKPPFRSFSDDELKFIAEFKTGELVVDPGTTIVLEGSSSAHLYTIFSGWAFRYKMLTDGRRQILNFSLPGDFLGLQAAVTKEMDHSIDALSTVVLCIFPRQKIWTLYNKHPGLSFDLSWIAAREERMLDDHLLSVGRRSALERVAYVMLHLLNRTRNLGLVSKSKEFNVPLTQQHLADALGLSLVHTNKTLRRLHERKLISWTNGRLKILDEDELVRLTGWQSSANVLRPLI